MKPFARINLSSAALRRGILVSSLALGYGFGRKARVGRQWFLARIVMLRVFTY